MTDKDSSVRPETEVLQLARQGDRNALSQLFSEHMPTVHRFAMRMCRDEDRARDVAQESMLTALKSFEDFRGDASFSTWLFTIARSHCGKVRRKADREPLHEEAESPMETMASAEPPPDAQVSHGQLSDVVEGALATLDPAEREVVLLRDVEGLPAKEAAEILGISVAALKSRLHRARAALRDHVKAAMGEVPAPPSESCPDVIAAFSEKLEGDLAESACSALEAHLAQCPACAARCESVRKVLGACSLLRTQPVTPAMRRTIEEILQGLQRAPGV